METPATTAVVAASSVADTRLICDSIPANKTEHRAARVIADDGSFTVELTTDCQFIVRECQPPKGSAGRWVSIQPAFHRTVDSNDVLAVPIGHAAAVVEGIASVYTAHLARGRSAEKAAVLAMRRADSVVALLLLLQ